MSTPGKLTNKVAIITGGGSGFGTGIVQKFISEGASVLILDINEANAKKVAAEQPDGRAFALKADVASHDDWELALRVVLEKFGKLDVVVNNAGVNHAYQSSIALPESEFDRQFRINVKQLYFSTKVIIPYFVERGGEEGGCFVNVSSVSATRPREGLVWYSASKAAVSNATRGLAAEWAPHKIRLNAICPVAGDTGMALNFLGEDTPEQRHRVISGIPLGRFCLPSDIGNAAAFLASDEAIFLTGVCVDVDGGRSI